MTNNTKKIIREKCKKIKLVLTDVDGVLTDGGMYYSKNGEELKKFNTKDGMGVQLLLEKRIKTILITKEKSKISQKRANKIKAKIYCGVSNKESKLKKICSEFNVNSQSVAYIGDDINDVGIMKLVGLSGSPKNGSSEVKKIANYVCKSKGGEGAFREFVDLIILHKFD